MGNDGATVLGRDRCANRVTRGCFATVANYSLATSGCQSLEEEEEGIHKLATLFVGLFREKFRCFDHLAKEFLEGAS